MKSHSRNIFKKVIDFNLALNIPSNSTRFCETIAYMSWLINQSFWGQKLGLWNGPNRGNKKFVTSITFLHQTIQRKNINRKKIIINTFFSEKNISEKINIMKKFFFRGTLNLKLLSSLLKKIVHHITFTCIRTPSLSRISPSNPTM